MNFARSWALTKITFQSHVFNWFWRTRDHRRDVRTDVLSRVAPGYFKKYLYAAAAVKEQKPINNDANEKIFSIWLQGEDNAPPLVKACFKSIRKQCAQELIVLDETTLYNYIKLPEIIMQKRAKGQIRNAHFADICRVELLHNHGGIWLDSTALATSKIPDDIISQDFFVYMVGNVGQKYSFMQNCFIRSRRGAYLLEAWRAMILEYWKSESKSFDYFMHQLLFQTLVENDPRAKKYFAKMPHIDQDPTHLLWDAVKSMPFNQKQFDAMTADAFFQKLSYNDQNAKNPIPGSFADNIINI